MNILAIETSCDETACAIVTDGTAELASSIATSQELHLKTGGIVPEVAARRQVESILPVIEDTLDKFCVVSGTVKGEVWGQIDAIAVTIGPGLIGSLIVGVEAAKAVAFAAQKPLIPVNHLVGHIYGNFVRKYGDTPPHVEFPALVLIVSGGHTDLVLMRGHGDLEYLGGTLDDAAGEAFDKAARLLNIEKYMGGPKLSKLAATSTNSDIIGLLPRPMLDKPGFDFSFSGLKTAISRVHQQGRFAVEDLALDFETAVVDVLVTKTIKAATKVGAKSILLGGGVSANVPLRTRMAFEAEEIGVPVHVPPFWLCTDTATYIASAAFFNQKYAKDFSEVQPNPSLTITG